MELAGSTWTLVSFEMDEEVIRAVSEGPVTLTFAAKGEQANRISGNGGCNRYFGSYTLTNDRINFGPLGSTRMACEPVRMGQEDRFFHALSTAERYELSNGELLIIYVSGTLRFVRS